MITWLLKQFYIMKIYYFTWQVTITRLFQLFYIIFKGCFLNALVGEIIISLYCKIIEVFLEEKKGVKNGDSD